MTTPSKTLTPLTASELELCFQVLHHSLSHPCHKCLELEELTDKINFFRLKAKGIAENNPAKVFPHGIKKKATPKFELESSTDTAIVDIPMPAQSLLDKLHRVAPETTKLIQGMSKVGNRTQNKKKYTKSPKNNFNA